MSAPPRLISLLLRHNLVRRPLRIPPRGVWRLGIVPPLAFFSATSERLHFLNRNIDFLADFYGKRPRVLRKLF